MSAVLNATTFFGRIVLGRVADSFGAWNTLTITVLICSMLNFAWSGVDSNAGLWVYAAIYGFFSGAVASLQGEFFQSGILSNRHRFRKINSTNNFGSSPRNHSFVLQVLAI